MSIKQQHHPIQIALVFSAAQQKQKPFSAVCANVCVWLTALHRKVLIVKDPPASNEYIIYIIFGTFFHMYILRLKNAIYSNACCISYPWIQFTHCLSIEKGRQNHIILSFFWRDLTVELPGKRQNMKEKGEMMTILFTKERKERELFSK